MKDWEVLNDWNAWLKYSTDIIPVIKQATGTLKPPHNNLGPSPLISVTLFNTYINTEVLPED